MAAAEGFQVHDVARGRHWITFSGAAEQVGRAFHTELHRYLVDGRHHFANATEPSVPAALAGVVSAIRGLDDFKLESQAKVVPLAPEFNTTTGRALAPADFATIYDLQPLYTGTEVIDGTGQTIAILGQTGIHLSDIQTFRARFNLPANNPQLMLFGADPGINQTDLGEADLDLEWSGAVAPNATIIYVYSSDVMTSAQYAIDQNLAPVMSLSYGGCEAYNSVASQAIAQQGNAQESRGWPLPATRAPSHVTATTRLHRQPWDRPSLPASMPEITAVGGSEFTDTSSAYWGPKNDPTTSASALMYVPEKHGTISLPIPASLSSEAAAAPAFCFPNPHGRPDPGYRMTKPAMFRILPCPRRQPSHTWGFTMAPGGIQRHVGVQSGVRRNAGAGESTCGRQRPG